MKILLAEDDRLSRRPVEAHLRKEGHVLVVTDDGEEAWAVLERDSSIHLAILDWMMPGLSGPEVCRRVRARNEGPALYLILLTARNRREDFVAGLRSGADDYIRKPVDLVELSARIQVAERVTTLQGNLADRIADLEEALEKVHVLQGLLPICQYCKKIRDDGNYWQQVDQYIAEHSRARFSHGVCPDCYERVVKPELQHRVKKSSEIEPGTSC